MTDPGAAEAAVGRAVAEYGALHILVNDAAYFTTPATIEDIPIDEWRRSIDVNLTGPFLMSRVAVPAIRNAGGGSIIHIASQLGSVGKPLRSDYCSAKGALIQLARSMAIDYAADNIRVNTLSPGPIGTPRIFERFGSEEAAQRDSGTLTLMQRLGRPEEIATAAAFLASDDASFMTGDDLLVDGGYNAI